MSIDRQALEAVISASGGAQQPDDQVEEMLAKLVSLEKTGRYAVLLDNLARSNDKSNFLALLLEVSFAHQFEQAGVPLAYEVKQIADQKSSIDFKLTAETGETLYFELRLLQQDAATDRDVEQQLQTGSIYSVLKNGYAEQADIFRLQSTILSKVQQPNGTPIKFLRTDVKSVNIVVVSISDILLGAADVYDCLLATYGDPDVPEEYRRNVFGLFQDVQPHYPANIQDRSTMYAHIKKTLHGVLFVFKSKGFGVLDYKLEQKMVWNRNIISEVQAGPLTVLIAQAIPSKKC